MINISSELANNATVQKFIKECPKRFNDVLEKATNKAATLASKLGERMTASEWGVKASAAKGRKISRARLERGMAQAKVSLLGLRTPLINLENVTPRSPMVGRTRGGVSVMLAGNQHTFRSAFVTSTKGGLKIAERIRDKATGKTLKTDNGKDRLRFLSTTSVAKMAKSGKTDITSKIAPDVQEEFDKTFIAEASAWLNTMGVR